MGAIIWLVGYSLNRSRGPLSALRPGGIVGLVIGVGIVGLGIVFSVPDSPNEVKK